MGTVKLEPGRNNRHRTGKEEGLQRGYTVNNRMLDFEMRYSPEDGVRVFNPIESWETAAPGGLLGWKEIVRDHYYKSPGCGTDEILGGFANYIQPKISKITKGMRLIPKHLEGLMVGIEL